MDTHVSHHHLGNRVEEFRLITGTGKYAADWNAPGQLYGYFVRADRAHAQLVAVKVARALAHSGVKHVFTGADAVRAGYTKAPHALTFPGRNGMQARAPQRPVLAHGKCACRQALALVVATTRLLPRTLLNSLRSNTPIYRAWSSPKLRLNGRAATARRCAGHLAFEAGEAGSAQSVAAAFAAAAHDAAQARGAVLRRSDGAASRLSRATRRAAIRSTCACGV
jgi:carbon-monoxide dehydrogenase large subunit